MSVANKKLSAAQIEAKIKKYLKKNHIGLNGTHFYSPKAWKERGEEYCNGARLVITTEGDLYDAINYGDCRIDGFNDFLSELGLWFELGTGWMIGIYED
jgi:hypothetical protein